MPQPKLFSIIDKAIFEYQMIEEGDRILIGASGGKDSTALVEYFARRKLQGREKFDFTALHVSTEIAPPFDPGLRELFASWGVEPVVIPVGVLDRLKPGRSMNCWWCSTQRRTELNEYAMANGYNKIALGHHLDDILETLLMNAWARVSFPPCRPASNTKNILSPSSVPFALPTWPPSSPTPRTAATSPPPAPATTRRTPAASLPAAAWRL